MPDEFQKAIGEIELAARKAQASGLPIQFVDSGNLDSVERSEDRAMVNFIIGLRGKLSPSNAYEAAASWRRMQTLPQYSNAFFLLGVAGFDDDPRELWDIPEASGFVRRWAKLAKLDSASAVLKSRLLTQSRGLLAKCSAVKDVHPDTVKTISHDEALKADAEEIEYRVL
jgi:hypothetical protein